ncbi:hypothetical protein ACTFIW_000463, partial [Dictyostelium discoideum]
KKAVYGYRQLLVSLQC